MRTFLHSILIVVMMTTYITSPVQANTHAHDNHWQGIVSTLDMMEEFNGSEAKNVVEVSAINVYFRMNYARQRIAIIDTGIAMSHPALSQMNVVNVWNMISNTTDVRDFHGHGTHIAGILASNGNQVSVSGLIPNAQYIIIKALDEQGQTDDNTLAQSIRRATNLGARVIVVSSGISVDSQVLRSAVDYAYTNNVLIVAAAGNNVNKPQFPAAYSTVLGVGSANQQGARSAFSPTGLENDVLALGENIVSLNTDRGTRTLSGTSMATPVVAALAMGLMEIYPSASVDEIMAHICLTSSNANRWNMNTGWGGVDFQVALSTPLGKAAPNSNNLTTARVLTIPRNTIITDATNSSNFKWYQVANGYAGELAVTIKKKSSQAIKVDLFDQNHRLVTSRTVTAGTQTVNFNMNADGMFLRISNHQHTSNIEYSLTLNFSIAPDIWESNNSIQQSKRIPLRASFDATFHRAGDYDWYYVDVVERGYLQVNVGNVPEYMDPVLQIQGNNNRFTIDQNAAGKEERFIRLVEPGRYQIGINDYNQNAINYPYTIDVSFTPINTSRLTDINQHWARNDINRLLTQGIVKGYENQTFRPNNLISRAEFATLLVSTLKLAYPESNIRAYRDVPTNHWAHYPLTIASNHKVVKGYPDQTFRPDAFVTRAEVASMVYEVYRGQLRYTTTKTYRDLPLSHWAYTPIMNLSRADILSGYNNQEFKPNALLTRAEAATIITRLLNL